MMIYTGLLCNIYDGHTSMSIALEIPGIMMRKDTKCQL